MHGRTGALSFAAYLVLASVACADPTRDAPPAASSPMASSPATPSPTAPSPTPSSPPASAATPSSPPASAPTHVSPSAQATPPSPSAPSTPPSPSPAPSPSSWLGVAFDASVPLPKSIAYDGATLRIAEGFRTSSTSNGMSEGADGAMATILAPKSTWKQDRAEIPKDAVLIISTHLAVLDVLLDYGGPGRLAMTGGARGTWEAPRATEVSGTPIFVLRGDGTLGSAPAELWQIRRKRPTSKDRGTTVLIVGALRKDAADDVRRGFFASLGSLVVE